MSDYTYSVSLTFREWMGVTYALGHTESDYRSRGLDGQANRYEAIQENIAEELKNE